MKVGRIQSYLHISDRVVGQGPPAVFLQNELRRDSLERTQSEGKTSSTVTCPKKQDLVLEKSSSILGKLSDP